MRLRPILSLYLPLPAARRHWRQAHPSTPRTHSRRVHLPSQIRERFAVGEGDHVTALNVYAAYCKAGQTRNRWCAPR